MNLKAQDIHILLNLVALGEGQWSYASVAGGRRDASEKAGIKIKRYNAIRHSPGCQRLDEGHDLSLVQEVLGHRNPQMTRRYAKRSAKMICRVLSMRRQACGRVAVENISTTS